MNCKTTWRANDEKNLQIASQQRENDKNTPEIGQAYTYKAI